MHQWIIHLLICWVNLGTLTKSTLTSPDNVISCNRLWLKPPNTRVVLGSMVHVPIIPCPLILDLQRTLIRSSPWRNGTSSASVSSLFNHLVSLCVLLCVTLRIYFPCICLFVFYRTLYFTLLILYKLDGGNWLSRFHSNNVRMNERTNERTNERMNEWMNEWSWMNELT